MFTSFERRVIILIGALLLLGGLLRFTNFRRRYSRNYSVVSGNIARKINVNTASYEGLIGIPGVGPATSRRIIQYRKTYGNFESLKDLDKIKEETVIFSGSAREAIKGFPKNVNITALLSIAAKGADETKIKIITPITLTPT